MKGTLTSVQTTLKNSRLKIIGKVQTNETGLIDALLPAREMAALLPRSVLLGTEKSASVKLLDTIQAIAARLIVGRIVRVWMYEEVYYFSFIAWSNVRFHEPEADACSNVP